MPAGGGRGATRPVLRRRALVVLLVVVGLVGAVVGCERRAGVDRPAGGSVAGARAASVAPVGLAAARPATTTTAPGTGDFAPTGPLVVPLGRGSAAPIRTYLLTGEAFDHYLLDTDGKATAVDAAATNVGGNTRLIWADLDDPVLVDS